MQCTQTVINLFGPVEANAALQETVPGDKFYWPGSCITSHCAVFQLEFPHKTLARAIWRMCLSQPAGRSLFRLVSCDDGPSNLAMMAEIDTNNKPPGIEAWNVGVDITAAMNAFLASSTTTERNIGWQVAGDNQNPFTVYACRLELTWQDAA